jgi:serine protease Do
LQSRSVVTIATLPWPRLIAVLGIAIAVGIFGGLAGGATVLNLDNGAAPTPVLVAVAATSAPPPSEGARMRDAIAHVFPSVVTIIADFPPETRDGTSIDSPNFGTGIVVSEQGLVITNFHVVDGATAITVVLSTGERRPAVLIADDSPFTDLAVLGIDSTDLRVASFGDSDTVQLGEPLAVIASGLITFENQVKLGVLSARQPRFPKEGVDLLDMLQTDAAANHGDSGAALVNLDGEVVGLITTVVHQSGGQRVEGVAIAHSANTLRPIVEAVETTGFNPRPRIGIERVNTGHIPITPVFAEAQGLPVSFGAVIVSVATGSPAETAGIEGGDIVIGVNGVQIDHDFPFVNLLGFAETGEELDLFVLRGDAQVVISVVPQIITSDLNSGGRP